MVHEALELVRAELAASIKPFADGITVALGSIATVAGTQGNTVLISLVNIEEESTLKNTSPYQRNTVGGFDVRNPPVFLNLYGLISANYSGIDANETALKLLSRTIQCFQRKNQYTVSNTPAATTIDNPQALMLQVTVDTGVAARGKSSMGWFYGLKAHLVIKGTGPRQYGPLVNVVLTPGNVADNKGRLLTELLAGLQGKCFGDRGYLRKLFAELYQQGLQLVTKLRGKMKNVLMPLGDKLHLRKRGLIEEDALIPDFTLVDDCSRFFAFIASRAFSQQEFHTLL